MKAITIHQPYASLISCGAKIYETRSWATKYRGRIAIHASKKFVYPLDERGFKDVDVLQAAHDAFGWEKQVYVCPKTHIKRLPYGAIIGTAELVKCWQVTISRNDAFVKLQSLDEPEYTLIPIDSIELLFGDFTVGRYAWELRNIEVFNNPVPARGQQGLWNWNGGQCR